MRGHVCGGLKGPNVEDSGVSKDGDEE